MLRQVEDLGVNYWSQPSFRDLETGMVFVDVNLGQGVPDWHMTTSEGEPIAPVRKDLVFEVIPPSVVQPDLNGVQ